MTKKPLPLGMIDRVAERFRALGDVTRIRILMRLQDGPANVSRLAEDLGVSQSSVSKHLTMLRHVGILQVQREGTQSHYSIKDPMVFRLCDLMCDGVRRHHEEIQSALDISPE